MDVDHNAHTDYVITDFEVYFTRSVLRNSSLKHFADVQLRGATGNVHHVHKAILSSYSPVLRDILLRLDDAQEICILFPDVDSDTVQNFINLFYTGASVNLSAAQCHELISVLSALGISGCDYQFESSFLQQGSIVKNERVIKTEPINNPSSFVSKSDPESHSNANFQPKTITEVEIVDLSDSEDDSAASTSLSAALPKGTMIFPLTPKRGTSSTSPPKLFVSGFKYESPANNKYSHEFQTCYIELENKTFSTTTSTSASAAAPSAETAASARVLSGSESASGSDSSFREKLSINKSRIASEAVRNECESDDSHESTDDRTDDCQQPLDLDYEEVDTNEDDDDPYRGHLSSSAAIRKVNEKSQQNVQNVYRFRGHRETAGISGSTKQTYSCFMCSFSTKQISVLRAHVLKHTGEKHPQALACSGERSLVSSGKGQRHKQNTRIIDSDAPSSNNAAKSIYAVSRLNCRYCPSKTFKTVSELSIHRFKAHGKDDNAAPFRCSVCQLGLSSKCSLEEHMQGMHTIEKRFGCEKCAQIFHWKSGLQRHRDGRCPGRKIGTERIGADSVAPPVDRENNGNCSGLEGVFGKSDAKKNTRSRLENEPGGGIAIKRNRSAQDMVGSRDSLKDQIDNGALGTINSGTFADPNLASHSSSSATNAGSTSSEYSSPPHIQSDTNSRSVSQESEQTNGQGSTTSKKMLRYFKSLKSVDYPLGTIVQCKFCSRELADFTNLKRHILSVHLRCKPFACMFCNLKFADRSSRYGHEYALHFDQIKQMGFKEWKNLKNRSSSNPVSKATLVKMIEQTIDHGATTNNLALQPNLDNLSLVADSHESTTNERSSVAHFKEPNYEEMSVDSKSKRFSDILTVEIGSHCDLDATEGAKTSDVEALDQHPRSDERRAMFKYLKSLKRSDYPLGIVIKCKFCDKELSAFDTLQKHIRFVHLNMRPYVCRFSCSKRFPDLANRRRHEYSLHFESVKRIGVAKWKSLTNATFVHAQHDFVEGNAPVSECKPVSPASDTANLRRDTDELPKKQSGPRTQVTSKRVIDKLRSEEKVVECVRSVEKTTNSLKSEEKVKEDLRSNEKVTGYQSEIARYLSSLKSADFPLGTLIACKYCEKDSFSQLQKLQDHIIAVHLHFKYFACRFCSQRFALGTNRSNHEYHIHLDEIKQFGFEKWKQLKSQVTKRSDIIKAYLEQSNSTPTATSNKNDETLFPKAAPNSSAHHQVSRTDDSRQEESKEPTEEKRHHQSSSNPFKEPKTSQCQLQSDDEAEHSKEDKIEHNDQIGATYKCSKCGQHLQCQLDLSQHETTFHDPTTSACRFCGMKFGQKDQCMQHEESAHLSTGVLYNCPVCGQHFKNRSSLVHHERTYHVNIGRQFACRFCAEVFPRKDLLLPHEDKHLSMGELYRCSHCDTKFKERISLQRHTMTMHTDMGRKYACRFCRLVFKQKDMLTKHEDDAHLSTGNLYRCSHCDKMFKERSNWRRHEMTVHSDTGRRFPCRFCEKIFKQKDLLAKHEEEVHLSK